MFIHYIKNAFRNLSRYPAYSILNVTGLAMGMASALLILLWVQYEWSFDRHFKNAGNIYRLIEKENPGKEDAGLLAATPEALPGILKEDYPEIIRSSSCTQTFINLKIGNENIGERIYSVDNDFFGIFSIRFVRGDINNAFNDPYSIILTEEISDKYFGNQNPVGKIIGLSGSSIGFTITGVVETLPGNSHFHFNFLLPDEFMKEFAGRHNEWMVRTYNYIELKEGTESETFEKKIRDVLKSRIKDSNSELSLQNLKDIHLFSSGKYKYDISSHGDIAQVRILGIVGLLILIIACMNFMNMSAALSASRVKEIGIRKIAGANKQKIIIQVLIESLAAVVAAHIIAMSLVELFLPDFNSLTGQHLEVNYHSGYFYFLTATILLLSSILAGSYPAIYLAKLQPVETLKGVIIKSSGSSWFRRILLVFQFSVSILLIISTLVIGRQFRFMQNKNMGFKNDNIVYFQYPTAPWDPQLSSLKKELSNNPDIAGVTMAFSNPLNIESYSGDYSWSGKQEGDKLLFYILSADPDYAKTFQLEIKEGRFFSSEFSTDNSAVVINETAAKVLGFKCPVGETLSKRGSEFSIIGVVKDFHIKSLHHKIEPLLIMPGKSNTFYVRFNPDRLTATIDHITKSYKSFNPSSPIDLHFLGDDFDNLYQKEKKLGSIFRYFTLITIIISCLGLIGLSLFVTSRRTKEIGIRKTNGARSSEIFTLLYKEYIILILISLLITFPVAYSAMNRWLMQFAYRIEISWWNFALAGIIILLVTFLTVVIQSYLAATRNPVEALRYE